MFQTAPPTARRTLRGTLNDLSIANQEAVRRSAERSSGFTIA